MLLVIGVVVLGLLLGPAQAWLVRSLPAAEPLWPARLRWDRASLGVGTITAALFALLAVRLAERPAALPAYLYVAAAGLLLAAIDVVDHRLPNALVLPSYVVVAALLTVAASVRHEWTDLTRAGLGAVALFGAFLLLGLAYPPGMGFGDVKLVGVLGAVLGYVSWGAVLGGIAAAFVLGAVAGVVVVLTGRGTARTTIPFGPFLLAGTLLAVLATGSA